MEPKKEQSCLEFLLAYAMGITAMFGVVGGLLYLLEKMGLVVVK